MNIYCREHAELLAIVRLHEGAWLEFVTLSPRWKAHHSAAVGPPGERANSFTNLSLSTRPEVEARGCSDCGARMLDVATLLDAVEKGRDKISL